MIGATQAPVRLGGNYQTAARSLEEFADMPRLLPVLGAAAAAPLLGLILHATAPAHGAGQPTAVLPNNLCASCHGGGRVVSTAGALDTGDLLAARAFLRGSSRG
jgi:hypothetical protein